MHDFNIYILVVIDQPPPRPEKSKIATSIGQQIIFKSVRGQSKKPGSVPRHIKERETPASLYLAVKLHIQTDSASLIDDMHQRGLCVSYDCLKVFSTYIDATLPFRQPAS